MNSPHDVLTAYSRSEILSREAIRFLHIEGYRELLAAMIDAGHPHPMPGSDEVVAQVSAALPILTEALKWAEQDHDHPPSAAAARAGYR